MAGALRLPSPGPVTIGLGMLLVAVLLARRASLRQAQQRKAVPGIVRPGFFREHS